MYGASVRTVQRWLTALQNGGFIRIQDGAGGSEQRKIFAGINPISETHDKNVMAPMTETSRPHDKNVADNMNNKKENKKEEQNPPKPPRGRAAKAAPDYEPDIFARFWTAYPIGRDKQAAIRAWDKLKPDRQLMQTMDAALKAQKETLTAENPRDRYPFPYAVRWLTGRRWEDDLAKDTPRAPETRGTKAPAYEPEVSAWP